MAPEAVVYYFSGETETKQVDEDVRVATDREGKNVARIKPRRCKPAKPGDVITIAPKFKDKHKVYLDGTSVEALTLGRDTRGVYVKE